MPVRRGVARPLAYGDCGAAEHVFAGRQSEEGFHDEPGPLRRAYTQLFRAGDDLAAAQAASQHEQRLGARSAAAAAAAGREAAA